MKLGQTAKCKITGYEGVIMQIADWMYAEKRIGLLPRKLLEGKLQEEMTFDINQCELVDKTIVVKAKKAKQLVYNGDKVEDPVSGAKGTVLCVVIYLNGCIRVAVGLPKKKNTGIIPDHEWLSQEQVIVKRKNKVKKSPSFTGGPQQCSVWKDR